MRKRKQITTGFDNTPGETQLYRHYSCTKEARMLYDTLMSKVATVWRLSIFKGDWYD